MLGPSLWMKKKEYPPGVIYVLIYFLLLCLLSLAFLPHLLCFTFYVLYFVFRKVSFLYCLLPFAF